MQSFNKYLLISVIVIGLCLPTHHSICQSKQTSKLEARITALEQKVKVLEARFLMMSGGKTAEIRRVRAIMRSEINNISIQAIQYFHRPASQNGGAGSFAGFSLAPKMAQTDMGNYSVVPSDTEVVIEGRPIILNGKIGARMNRTGKTENWTFAGDLIDTSRSTETMRTGPELNWEVMRGEVLRIVENAYVFRTRARNLGGGGGSYSGYTIPPGMASSNTGMYAVQRGDSALLIEVRSKASNTMAVVTGDSAGKIKNWATIFALAEPKKPSAGAKTAVDSVRDNITFDFTAIAARAYQYKIRPVSNGGGGGKFTDYLSAQTSSFEGTVRYDLQIDPDIIVLRAISASGQGTVSAKVDGNGKLSGWYYTGEFAK